MNVRALGSAVMACAFLFASSARAAAPDEVLLANGGRLRGTVMEDDPVKGVSIQLLDGSTRRVPHAEVARVQYAGAAPAPAQPVAAQPVAVQPVGAQPFAAPASAVSVSAPPGIDPGLGAQPSLLGPPLPGQPSYASRGHTIPALWITGLSLWGVVYFTTIGITAAEAEGSDRDKAKSTGESAIPVVGPWVLIADAGHALTGAELGGLVASGILQPAALAMVVLGATVRVGGSDSATTLAPVPIASGGMVALTGRF